MPSSLAKLVSCKECHFCGNECPHLPFGESFHHHECKTPTSFPAAALLVAAIAIIVAVLAAPFQRRPTDRRDDAGRTGPRVKRERAARRRQTRRTDVAGAGGDRHPPDGAALSFRLGHRHRRQYRDRHQPGRWPADGDPLYRRPAGQSRRSAGGNRSPAVRGSVDPAQGQLAKIRPRWPMPGAIWRAISNW